MEGTIKIGKATAGHGATLRQLGYEVVEHDDHIAVTGEGTVDELDLSAGTGPLKEVISKKQLLTYRTRVTFDDGKTLFGVPACTRLGQLSALIVSIPKVAKAKAPALMLSDLGL